MAEDRIYYLMDRFLRNVCTGPEKEELAQWINQSAHDVDLRQLLEKIWHRYEPASVMPAAKADLVLSAILKSEPAKETTPPARIWKGRFLRLAVAACVAAVLGLLGYFLLADKHPDSGAAGMVTAEKKAATNDVAPGGNKAVLTLGNGRKINLDSAGNGTLASQGTTQILKLANGQLAYSGLNEEPTEVEFNTLSTPAGGQYQLTLPDGSKVWLDASSFITYPTAFTGSQRKVMISGQAYFEIARNENLPFVVQKGALSIQVLGTHFNVNAYDDESTVKTTLLEGSVKIVQGDHSTLITPGQQIQVAQSGAVRLIKNADLEEAVAWKNGFFKFNRSDLPSVMRQLSRWYNVDVVYQGDIPQQQFGGKMERDLNLSEILDGLKRSGVHFKIDGRKLIVMP